MYLALNNEYASINQIFIMKISVCKHGLHPRPEVCGFLIELDAVPDCNVDMTHMRDWPQFLLNVMLIRGSSFEWSEFAEVPINN